MTTCSSHPPHASSGFLVSPRNVAAFIRGLRSDAFLAQMLRESTPAQAFDALYRRCVDPWGSLVSSHSQRKYRDLVALLASRRFANALEIGCGLGILTRQLTLVAERVRGVDISAVALEAARKLSAEYPSIHYQQADLFALDEQVRFDLVVLADVLYYILPPFESRLKTALGRVEQLLAPGGTLLLANRHYSGWDPPSRLTRAIHSAFSKSLQLRRVSETRRYFYLASLYEKVT